MIPVCWRTDAGASGCEVLDTQVKSVRLPACPAWAYFNAGGTGYYRTIWTTDQLSQLRLSELTPAERLTLVGDLHAQSSDAATAKPVLEKLAKDAEPEIAQAAREALK